MWKNSVESSWRTPRKLKGYWEPFRGNSGLLWWNTPHQQLFELWTDRVLKIIVIVFLEFESVWANIWDNFDSRELSFSTHRSNATLGVCIPPWSFIKLVCYHDPIAGCLVGSSMGCQLTLLFFCLWTNVGLAKFNFRTMSFSTLIELKC